MNEKYLTTRQHSSTAALHLSDCKGTYALILYLSSHCSLRVGRMGVHEFKRGYYLYIGSAFGTGGLAARIRHHIRLSDRPHWHIDYLRTVSGLKAAWIVFSGSRSDDRANRRLEHVWASVVEKMPNARIPIKEFGSSDCRCASHLFYFGRKPRLYQFQAALRKEGINEPIRVLTDFSLSGIDKPILLGYWVLHKI
jgi:Uri superfamily endonuclease